MLPSMSSRIEIQKEIEQLPQSELLELARWINEQVPPEPSAAYKEWIKTACGAGVPGVTTEQVMELTRGE